MLCPWLWVGSGHCSISICPKLAGVSNLRPTGHRWPRMAMNTAQHKILNLLKSFFPSHQFSLVSVYLVCGPRPLFLFQCGPEMRTGRTPHTGCPAEIYAGVGPTNLDDLAFGKIWHPQGGRVPSLKHVDKKCHRRCSTIRLPVNHYLPQKANRKT